MIDLNKLTKAQVYMIRNHRDHSSCGTGEAWHIDVDVDELIIHGWVDMDNFDMYEFLTEQVEVDPDVIRWNEYP